LSTAAATNAIGNIETYRLMMLLTIEFDNLHTILRSLYSEMMPLCSNMAGVAKGIAGLGALFYVAVRVWQSLARAEAIDVYP
ncbi:hypothetical protein, partial [Levilactobacillus namurensis]|uniref:hypothetical protein n=1 Tax=Levilactobacillus namurensis TaxID=380393 RepID=UPI003F7FA8F1